MTRKEELLEVLENARTWREVQMTVDEVLGILLADRELEELQEKVEKLTESNRQLRAENRKLKGK